MEPTQATEIATGFHYNGKWTKRGYCKVDASHTSPVPLKNIIVKLFVSTRKLSLPPTVVWSVSLEF